MGMGFAPTWLRQVSPPLLHMTTLTIAPETFPIPWWVTVPYLVALRQSSWEWVSEVEKLATEAQLCWCGRSATNLR